MATQGNSPLGSQKGLGELWVRLKFLLLAIMVYRLGTHIPVPGIDPEQVANLLSQNQGTMLGMFNMFSGGAFERMSILALGIMPYISASIIMQMMTAVTPTLEALKKEGEAGRRKISQYTRYLTVCLALVQAFVMVRGLAGQGMAYAEYSALSFYVIAVVSLVTGAVFMMWLGEQVTERGIGNGISMLIFAGIVAGLPAAVGSAFESARQGDIHLLMLLAIAFAAVAVVWFVVRMERGQRRITIQYARKQVGRSGQVATQTSHLPLKINMAGVIPVIFASSILLFPTSIAQWMGSSSEGKGGELLQDFAAMIGPGQPLNFVLFGVLIILFCFVYTAMMYNPKEVADNLKKGGAYIPGIRPGEQSAKYIDNVLTRLTVVGSLYIAAVALLPQFLTASANIPVYVGGTSLLIVVVVVMDFMSQVQSHLMTHQYDSVMKKANLQSYGRTR
ncbi:preprotein translocase subunit SecY [Agarilytica rhodophyticola]|uniref:preprotein translocase subunit SecY n=1 Tax=Agarilytica rhodophyticola TaxID=1737490 RepID=UPI000B3440DF|nr:preprotein translocase subunit SecY [Agarilytica rhodophyticola]